jgi:hypothetical protein
VRSLTALATRTEVGAHSLADGAAAGGGNVSVNTVNLTPFRVIGIRFALMQTAEGLWEYAVSQGNA